MFIQYIKGTLINYWPLSNLSDVIGGANLYGGMSYSFVADRFNNSNSAIYFNGGYLQVPPGVYFSGDFSLIAWINLKSYQSFSRIIDFGNAAAIDNVVLTMYSNTSQLMGVTFVSTSETRIFSPGLIQLNQWYHVAFALSGTNGSIYLNGVPVANATLVSPNNLTRNLNYVGRSNSGNPYPNAVYDDLRIYQGSLSAAQILNDYTTTSLNGIYS